MTRLRIGSLIAVTASVASLLGGHAVAAPTWQRIPGVGALQPTSVTSPDTSADGRTTVALATVDGKTQVVAYDRVTRRTTLVSVGLDKAPGNGKSTAPSVSGDGRYVTFFTSATNIVPDREVDYDISGFPITKAVVRDMARGKTLHIFKRLPGYTQTFFGLGITRDGRYIFADIGNAGASNSGRSIYRLDRVSGSVTLASVDTRQERARARDFGRPDNRLRNFSADGRHVAFFADVQVTDPNTGRSDGAPPKLYIRDISARKTTEVEFSETSAADTRDIFTRSGNLRNFSLDPTVDDTGTLVAFITRVPLFLDPVTTLWLHNTRTRRTIQVDRPAVGTEDDRTAPVFGGNGAYLYYFRTSATGDRAKPAETAGLMEFDTRTSQITERLGPGSCSVDSDPDDAANQLFFCALGTNGFDISSDGRVVAISTAAQWTADDNNGDFDVYLAIGR